MTNKDFLSYFNEPGISMISYCNGDGNKLRTFFAYLANKSLLITDLDFDFHTSYKKIVIDDIDEKILDILIQYKDQNVFISIPTSNWFIKYANGNSLFLTKSQELRNLLRKMYQVSCDNNLSITLLNYTYNSPNMIGVAPTSLAYSSNLAVFYKDEKFFIQKNRYGQSNIEIDINKLKPVFVKEYREKKLKRILQ